MCVHPVVQSQEELRTWILEGKSPRLESKPPARYFLARQQIKVPAYDGVPSEEELRSIVTCIQHLRKQGRK